jgi:hypothetical protein
VAFNNVKRRGPDIRGRADESCKPPSGQADQGLNKVQEGVGMSEQPFSRLRQTGPETRPAIWGT